MGLRSFIQRQKLKYAAREIEKKVPMTRFINWLTESPGAGRKRGLALILLGVSIVLRAVDPVLDNLCLAGFLAVCDIHVSAAAPYFDYLHQVVENLLIPGTDFTAVVLGAWGIWAARKKNNG